MASVFRKSYTKPLPAAAELFTRKGQEFARWRVGGKLRTAKVTIGKKGEPRIRIAAETYTAKYRDGSGIVQESATGCRDKTAAQSVLRELVARAERVKSGLVSVDDDAAIDYQHTPLAELLVVYVENLRAKGRSAVHIADCDRLAKRAFRECGFVALRDIAAEPFQRWLTSLTDSGLSPRTRNSYLQAVRGFCRWCAQSNRLPADPTQRISKAAEAVDIRRQRRSLTVIELERLFYAAKWRPLAEQGRQTIPNTTPKGRATWKLSPLTFDTLPAAIDRAREKLADKPEKIAELEKLGRERILIYKTLILTGLRRAELASLTISSVVLSGPMPYVLLEAANAKNRQQGEIPLRADIAGELALWVADKQEAHSEQTGTVLSIEAARGEQLSPDTRLFPSVTREFIKVLDRDLAAADIDKRDERGHTVDVHALRHTFGSLLSAGGVAPRTAQAAMRHSSIDLTMNTYTDPRVLDVAGALDSLPRLSLEGSPQERQRNLATGTGGQRANREFGLHQLAPVLAPNSDKRCKLGATDDNWAENSDATKKRSRPEKLHIPREKQSDADGIRTRNLRIDSPGNVTPNSLARQQVASTGLPACTSACTNLPENANETLPELDDVANSKCLELLASNAELLAIVEAWPELPEVVRAGVVAMVRVAGGKA